MRIAAERLAPTLLGPLPSRAEAEALFADVPHVWRSLVERPLGEWNFQEVTVKGSTLKVELNGTVILDTDLSQVDMKTVMANKAHPGATRTAGFFGLAGHTDPVAFKDMFIRRLDNK